MTFKTIADYVWQKLKNEDISLSEVIAALEISTGKTVKIEEGEK